ncbi:hypothetical protein PCL_08643 [Purpureocillium lilacinum]|uniref:C2H2-type domain-containing protein n=1 Tax=Purpureocillium lilacinum TaxID=33203 RepID=A0A2U3DR34_PURLI|nr:hypothetical protein PCL_08643 [Purpureocillium lilacinum]
MLLYQQIESAPLTAHNVTRVGARLTAQTIEDKPSDLPNQGSLFPCPLQFAGCQTPCGNTNEWKRHVSTKHLRHLIFRCAEGSCATGTARRNCPRHDTLMEHTSKQHGGKAKYEVLRAEAPSSLPCFVEGCKESFSGWRWYTDLLEHWLGHTMDAKCHNVFSREPGRPNETAFVDFGIERGFIARDETGRLQCPKRPSGTHYHVVERRYTQEQESACSCGWTGTVGSKTRPEVTDRVVCCTRGIPSHQRRTMFHWLPWYTARQRKGGLRSDALLGPLRNALPVDRRGWFFLLLYHQMASPHCLEPGKKLSGIPPQTSSTRKTRRTKASSTGLDGAGLFSE